MYSFTLEYFSLFNKLRLRLVCIDKVCWLCTMKTPALHVLGDSTQIEMIQIAKVS